MRYRQGMIQPLVLLALLASLASAAWAGPKRVSYDEILAGALARSPLVKEIEAEAARRGSEGIALGTLDNPELSLESRQFVHRPPGQDNEYEIELAQPLRLSSFGARGRLARLMQEEAGVQRRLALHELGQSLYLLYGKAWSLQERRTRSAGRRARLERLRASVVEGREKGLYPLSATLILDAQAERLSAESRIISTDAARALLELGRRSGLPLLEAELSPLELAALKGPEELGADERTPALERVRLRSRLAREQRELARLDAFPKFAPRLAFEHTAEGGDRINLGFTMELPLFSRNQAERSRAGAEAAARESEEQILSESLPALVAALRRSASESAEHVALYRTKVVPALSKALEAAQKEMSEGQTGSQTVIAALEELGEAEERMIELWVKALSERAELAVLLGREI